MKQDLKAMCEDQAECFTQSASLVVELERNTCAVLKTLSFNKHHSNSAGRMCGSAVSKAPSHH
jgi:hypothetical protein